MPGAATTSRRKTKARPRKRVSPADRVEHLCLMWRLILAEREKLAAKGRGNDRFSRAAAGRLRRLDEALREYVEAQRGKERLKKIVDQWCGQHRADALEAAEALVVAFLGYVAGRSRHRKRATALKSPRGAAVGLRPFNPRELVRLHADEVER